MEEVVTAMGAAIESSFQANAGNTALKDYEWRPYRDHFGDWKGTIEFVCGTPEELQKIFDKLHGNGIEANGMCAVV